jgi:hypothetical protein
MDGSFLKSFIQLIFIKIKKKILLIFRLKRLKVKEAKQQSTEIFKGLIVNKNNLKNDNLTQSVNEHSRIRKNSFDQLMDNMLILDRSIFEYKFIFARNLQGNTYFSFHSLTKSYLLCSK